MPLYEYRCDACDVVSQVLTRSLSEEPKPVCTRCSGTRLTRMMSRVARIRTTAEAWDAAGPPDAPGSDYYRDPRNIGRKVEQDFQRYGVELPHQVREKIDAARDGKLPKGLDL
ncbi:MAG: zinc ribbon domain-containing protein [SAR202 cluster bacterium]|nr:zinc ribbon domain-containing protein [SAR202 cluster bacterium]